MLRAFASDCCFLERAVSLCDSHGFTLNGNRHCATGCSKTVKLRVVDLLYRRLLPLISDDGRGDTKRESYDCQAYEGRSARSNRDPGRGGGHKETSKN